MGYRERVHREYEHTQVSGGGLQGGSFPSHGKAIRLEARGCQGALDDARRMRRVAGAREDVQERAFQNLYPNLRSIARRSALSASFSTPFGEEPSITPTTPLPWSVSATRHWRGLPVAQKMRHTSGHALS